MKKLTPYIFMALIFGFAMFLMLLVISPMLGFKIVAIAGLSAGILFSLLMYLFSKSKRISAQAALTPEEEKQGVIYSEGANHTLNSEAVGGQLYLTSDNLIFKSHNVAINRHNLTIALGDIVRAEPSKVMKVLPTGLKIILRDGKEEIFVISNQDRWVKEINSVLKTKQQSNN